MIVPIRLIDTEPHASKKKCSVASNSEAASFAAEPVGYSGGCSQFLRTEPVQSSDSGGCEKRKSPHERLYVRETDHIVQM